MKEVTGVENVDMKNAKFPADLVTGRNILTAKKVDMVPICAKSRHEEK